MPHNTDLISLIAVGLGIAFLLGLLAQKLRLSPLVGYLLAGIVVGPYTPGFSADQDLANQLSEIGVMLLMFGVGLHFSLKELMEVRAIAFIGAISRIVLITALGWLLAWFFHLPDGVGIMLGLALSIASTVVLLRTLEEYRLLDNKIGRIAIGWVVVEDLAMVLALVLLPALASALGGQDTTGATANSGSVGNAMLVTFGKVGAFIAMMLLVGRRVIPWLLERVAGTGSRELFTLCVLAVAMGVAYGAAAMFDVSFALGSFFAGMLLHESEFGQKAASDSLPLRDAFAVLFFVAVGMLFDPAVLIEQPLQVLGTFLIIVLVKAWLTYFIVRRFGYSKSKAVLVAVSLAQIGEFSFILAGLGVSLKILPQDTHDLILAGALLSIIFNPFIFSFFYRRHKDALTAKPIDNAPLQPDGDGAYRVPEDTGDHTIVVGYGRVGSHLAGLLQQQGVTVVVIEEDDDRVRAARLAGIVTVRGNTASEPVLLEARPETAQLAVFAIPRALEAGEAIARLRALNPSITVLARAHSEGEVRHLLQHGADGAVLAERELAHSLNEMIMATPPYRGLRSKPAAGG
ncbi:YbaL family putative K(+) efflux transporter [Pseudoxanthomonas dokdonensis]|uniref:Cation:proton antiport protein n=1 Tax=Pseudoxanthomonas dokdonensis TaxID=344882 RepID=A0A0R0CXY9_9GAMM|nr:YbaL family putative K(+) efflux transporter [Pseudoxanthomonas dokdonensis]KRG69976.1 cation:proton antiport protein [Pseudoxanthomonas dokdonensis]